MDIIPSGRALWAGPWLESKRGEAVVLIHGLWMTGTEMRVLGVRLEEAGFRVRYFRYRSWRGGLAQAAAPSGSSSRRRKGSGCTSSGTAWGRRDREDARGGPPFPAGSRGDAGGSDGRERGGEDRVPTPGRAMARGRRDPGGDRRTCAEVAGRTELLVVAGDIPLGSGFFSVSQSPTTASSVSRKRASKERGTVTVRASHVGLLLSRKVATLLSDHFRGG